jgi:hypothetical protein
MWWQPKQPATEAERQQEMRLLEAVREKLLNEAAQHFYFRRLLLPVMISMMAYVIGYTAWRHPLQLTPVAVIFFAAFCFIVGYGGWLVWHNTPAPGDRWGFSDALSYDGDSPRDLQKKIDALKARSSTENDP